LFGCPVLASGGTRRAATVPRQKLAAPCEPECGSHPGTEAGPPLVLAKAR
jgi:hypothetical protein